MFQYFPSFILTRMNEGLKIMLGMLQRDEGLVVYVSSVFGALRHAPFMGVNGPIKQFVSSLSRQLSFESAFSGSIDV